MAVLTVKRAAKTATRRTFEGGRRSSCAVDGTTRDECASRRRLAQGRRPRPG